MKTALTELIERLTDNDELLIDLLWEVKEGKKHPNRAYKELRQAYIKGAELLFTTDMGKKQM